MNYQLILLDKTTHLSDEPKVFANFAKNKDALVVAFNEVLTTRQCLNEFIEPPISVSLEMLLMCRR